MSINKSFLVVGTDFSSASDEALAQAEIWARRDGMDLRVCHVLPQLVGSNPMFPERTALQQAALTTLQARILDRIEQQVLACTQRSSETTEAIVETGDPASALLRLAQQDNVRGIVVGATHPSSPGHTAERVVRYATCTVLMAKKTEPSGHVLVATDLSDPSLPAINAGIRAAESRGARLTLLHCLEWPVMPIVDGAMGIVWQPDLPEEVLLEKRAVVRDRLTRILEVARAEGDIRCETGMPTETILRVAAEERSDLIVLGSHGHSAWTQVALGSVSEWILRAAPTSVQVVRMPGNQ